MCWSAACTTTWSWLPCTATTGSMSITPPSDSHPDHEGLLGLQYLRHAAPSTPLATIWKLPEYSVTAGRGEGGPDGGGAPNTRYLASLGAQGCWPYAPRAE